MIHFVGVMMITVSVGAYLVGPFSMLGDYCFGLIIHF